MQWGYFLYHSEDTKEAIEEIKVPPVHVDLQDIITSSPDIFSKPKGLPPHRAKDHTIPLLPGAIPPNMRPYMMSHSQKTVIETIIKQMLQNNKIKTSSSPFSSPIILVCKKINHGAYVLTIGDWMNCMELPFSLS